MADSGVGAGTPSTGPPMEASPNRRLGLLLVFSLLIHLPWHFDSLYGESDAARLVNDAFLWQKVNVRLEALSEYRYYSSPGYIWLAKQAVALSGVSGLHPALLLNSLGILAAAGIVAPVYLLFRRLLGEPAAVYGTVLLVVMPSFWQGGLYGFPNLLAACPFLGALLLLDRALVGDGAPRRDALLACALLVLTLLLKADFILSAVAAWGLLLYRRRLSWHWVLALSTACVLAIAALSAVSERLLQKSPDSVRYMAGWSARYGARWTDAFTVPHLRQVNQSFGAVTLALFAVSCLHLVRLGRFRLLAVLVPWAAVPLGFWFVRLPDSARHHFQSTIPVALGVGLMLGEAKLNARLKHVSLLAILLINYFAYAPQSSTHTSSGRLFESSRLLRARMARLQAAAREYVARDLPRKVVLGAGTNAYVDNEILYQAEAVTAVRRWAPYGYDAIDIEYMRGGKAHVSTSVRVSREQVPAAAAAYRKAGYAVFSVEYGPRIGYSLSEL